MPLLILVVVVLVVGVVIVARNGTPAGSGSPAAQVQDGSASGRGPSLGLWCLAFGLLAAAGVAMVGQATFGWVAAFDPPGWLRVAMSWLFPVGVGAAAIVGTLSLKRESGRAPGVAGLILAGLSAVTFFAMVASVDY